MNIYELLGITGNESALSPDDRVLIETDNRVYVDIDVATEIAESEIEDSQEVAETVEDLITGTEGLYQLLARPELTSGFALTNLSGCENFVSGIMYAYDCDLNRVNGTEGFFGAIGNGIKSMLSWISGILKSIWNFFTGGDKKPKDSIKESKETIDNDYKDIEGILKDIDGQTDEELKTKITPLVQKLHENVQKLVIEPAKDDEEAKKLDLYKDQSSLDELLVKFLDGKVSAKSFISQVKPLLDKIMNKAVSESEIAEAATKDMENQVKKIEDQIDNKTESKPETEEAKKTANEEVQTGVKEKVETLSKQAKKTGVNSKLIASAANVGRGFGTIFGGVKSFCKGFKEGAKSGEANKPAPTATPAQPADNKTTPPAAKPDTAAQAPAKANDEANFKQEGPAQKVSSASFQMPVTKAQEKKVEAKAANDPKGKPATAKRVKSKKDAKAAANAPKATKSTNRNTKAK